MNVNFGRSGYLKWKEVKLGLFGFIIIVVVLYYNGDQKAILKHLKSDELCLLNGNLFYNMNTCLYFSFVDFDMVLLSCTHSLLLLT